MVSKKTAKFENPGYFFLKCRLWSIAAKLENIWTKFFLQEGDQELCGKNSVCQILILFLWLVTPPCFQVKVSQILQKVIVFFLEKEDEIKASFWHIWIVQWLKFFRTTAYFFRFLPSSGGKEEKRCPFGPKVLTLGPLLFHK